MLPTFTIGIEEEYQTVDPVTRDLRSHIHAEIIEKGKLLLQERGQGRDAPVGGRSGNARSAATLRTPRQK